MADAAKLVESAMQARGLDPKSTSKAQLFEALMWEDLLTGDGKRRELSARILGRGYIGERGEDQGAKPLKIENYEDGLKTMMGPAKDDRAPGAPAPKIPGKELPN
jgi:hypothetical protein